jgi:pimeloyl-ACP methyl ester carboxylesterase
MTPRWVDTPVGRFAYLERGAAGAPPVLYLHGFPDVPTTAGEFLDALAAAGYRVLAPWLRGYAPSTTGGPFDLGQLTDDVEALAAALAPGRPLAVVGHDWGAMMTHLAASRPGPLACAVTLAVPHPLAVARRIALAPRQLLASRYILAFQLPGAAARMARDDFAAVDALWRRWSPGFALDGEARAELHRWLAASWPAPLSLYRALLRPTGEARRRLRALALAPRSRVPLLHLHGERDGCIRPAMLRDQPRYGGGGFECEVVGGVGHFLQHEAPTAIAGRIAAWLSRHHR